jgi:hypothetical protein
MAPSTAMSEPAPAPTARMTPPVAPAAAPTPNEPTHPCARCGAPVPLDVGLCERCNPLGLKDSASSQVHGTVLLAVGVAVLGLAVAARIAVSGIGPFQAAVTNMQPGSSATSVVATMDVTNHGTAAGSATCRLTDPADRGVIHSEVVYTPRISPGQTITLVHETPFGSVDRPFDVECHGP